MLSRGEFKLVDKIIEDCGDDVISGSWIRSALNLMTKKDLLDKRGAKLKEEYRIKEGVLDEHISEFISDTYGEDIGDLPTKFQEYHREYGFDDLVSRVSKWIDHNGVTQRDYPIDRLWLGRFIDFLDKAREYIKWQKADQALARKKLNKIRQKND